MTDPTRAGDDLPGLDARLAAAAQGLTRHVATQLADDDPVPRLATGAPPRRPRLVAAAAVLALLVGTLVAVSQRADDTTRVELDDEEQADVDLEPGVLRPLGPRDGKDSVKLPVTAEPATGLVDGDVVTVTGTGFEPGEQVGIVQCAREAGGDTPEARGGIDGCNLGTVQYADADGEGVATGTIAVRRILTTGITGTIDCAAEAERCMVAMGALADYDRSGGAAVAFAPADPIALPAVSATPTEGLADGDLVHIVADGLTPRSTVGVSICSSDPATCWETGEVVEIEGSTTFGLAVDDRGHAQGDVPVWRFLPGGEPGTYVDCAVSECTLRVIGELAPPTVRLRFDGGGEPPSAPSIGVEPSSGLAPGDDVVVVGSGFQPGARVTARLCASPVGSPAQSWVSCGWDDQPVEQVDDDGVRLVLTVPELRLDGAGEVCEADGTCTAVTAPAGSTVSCDGVTFDCYVWVDVAAVDIPFRPLFSPAPVPVTFR